jgi:hypothetical protein
MDLSKVLRYPNWAQPVYASEQDGVLDLFDSLSEGDVIQLDQRKGPLRVAEVTDGEVYVEGTIAFETPTYQIKHGDGRKYSLYLHRSSSKVGIGGMAVIYRADGSISEYTLDKIRELVDRGQKFQIKWEDPDFHTRPAMPDEPVKRQQKRIAEMRASDKKPKDIDGLITETDFTTESAVTTTVLLPTDERGVPHGTVFFSAADKEGLRRAVPMPQLLDFSVIDE